MQAAEESVHKFGLGGCSSRHEYGEMSTVNMHSFEI